MNPPQPSRSKSSHMLTLKTSEIFSPPKHSLTPSSQKKIAQKISMPLTTRAHPSSDKYVRLSEKPRLIKSTYIPSCTRALTKDQKQQLTPKFILASAPQPHTKPKKCLPKTPSIFWNAKTIFKKPPSIIPKKSLLIKIPEPYNTSKTNENPLKSYQARTQTGSSNGKTKSHNQDTCLTLENYNQSSHQHLFGIFDGHGLFGHEVSNFVKKILPAYLSKSLPDNCKTHIVKGPGLSIHALAEIPEVFNKCFFSIQEALTSHPHIDVTYSGTTTVLVYINGKTCICANVGDSRAVIGRFTDDWEPIELSQDHKPEKAEEKCRIENSGGRVEPFFDPSTRKYVGPFRVWVKNQQLPGLAMSRSFGDVLAASIGVICQPEVFIHTFTKDDKFVIVASDGVWGVLDSIGCVKVVSGFYEEGNVQGAADALMGKVLDMWSKKDNSVDDITFIIVFL